MDVLTWGKLLGEIRAALPAGGVVTRVVDLPGQGFGFILKTADAPLCLAWSGSHDIQGLWLTTEWEECLGETPFVRALNRHLLNARPRSVDFFAPPPAPTDRVIRLHFEVREKFFGEKKSFDLIGEFTGRITTALLCDSDGTVLEQWRPTRNNAPGERYSLPDGPSPASLLDPFSAPEQDLGDLLKLPSPRWRERIPALSPILCRELEFRIRKGSATSAPALLREILSEAISGPEVHVYTRKPRQPEGTAPVGPRTGHPWPWPDTAASCGSSRLLGHIRPVVGLVPERTAPSGLLGHIRPVVGLVSAISAADLSHLGETCEATSFPGVGEALAWIQKNLVRPSLLDELRSRARRALEKDLTFKSTQLAAQKALLADYEQCERQQRIGNLILCNVKNIPLRAELVVLNDLSTGEKVEVALDPRRTASQNAQRYFIRYKRQLRGIEEAGRRSRELESDIVWLKEQIWFCESATSPADLVGDWGRKPARKAEKKRDSGGGKPEKSIRPLVEIDGCRFYVGRNGRQNDILTFRLARKSDVWFHANDVPGSHVIARRPGGSPEGDDLVRGATLAAWFSFARDSGKVAVDYTEVGNVKRIPGGGPGRVSYSRQKTLFVNPGDAVQLLGSSGQVHS